MTDMNKELQDRIDAYLRNEMGEEERVAFERDVELDHDLASLLNRTRRLQAILGSHCKKMEMMRQWNKEFETETKSVAVLGNRGVLRRRWVYVAMSLVACLCLGYWLLLPVSQKEGYVYDASWFELENAYRGANDYRFIDSLFVAGRYAEALTAVDSMELVCHGELKDFMGVDETALTEEELYYRQVVEEMLYQLSWYRIHVLLAQGKVGEARPILEEYQQRVGTNRTKACRLWHVLNGSEE